MRWVSTVRVLDLTLTDSSCSLAYIRGVQGSTVLGNLKDMSPRAIMRLALITGSTDLSRTVKSSWRFCSQNSLDTSMNLDRAREALARRFGSGNLVGFEQIEEMRGHMAASREPPYRTSFSHTVLMNSASASSASAPTTPMSSSSVLAALGVSKAVARAIEVLLAFLFFASSFCFLSFSAFSSLMWFLLFSSLNTFTSRKFNWHKAT